MRIDGVAVPAWSPTVHVADAVTERDAARAFATRIAGSYDSPPIVVSPPQPLMIGGGRWVVATEADGLVRSTTFLIPRFQWLDMFRQLAQPATILRWTEPMLVAGTRYPDNHFHWIFQNVGTVLAARALGLDPATPVLLPPLDARRRASLALFGIDGAVEVLPDDALAILTDGILSTTCSGDHGMVPHPAMLSILRDEGRRLSGPRSGGRRLYLSRRDAANGRLPVNEAEAAEALAARGFEVVACADLSLAEQIALFRDAAIVVAPHGAALTNLAWAEDGADGPVVVELFQENFTNRCFARLCQAKGLTYHAIVCECAEKAPLLIDTRGRIDVALLSSVIDRLG